MQLHFRELAVGASQECAHPVRRSQAGGKNTHIGSVELSRVSCVNASGLSEPDEWYSLRGECNLSGTAGMFMQLVSKNHF